MKILVYIDPSFRGEWALSPALDLARGLARTILLLTTRENLDENPKLLEHAAERFSGTKDLVIEKKVRPGPPRDAILAESRESSPAITVFPPAGRWSIARMLRGSRVKAVVHNSPSTVMVARKPVSEHIQRILVTVSGGPFSETTLMSAQEIAKAVNAELFVLHVTSTVSLPYGEVKHERPESPPAAPQLKELQGTLARLGLESQTQCREGMVVREILAECHEGHYDLLILGQHLADKATGGPLSENIAEILAMESPIPVLVVRPRRWAAQSLPGSK